VTSSLTWLAYCVSQNLKKLQLRGLNVGRYMIFFLPKFEKLEVLDIATAKIEDYCLQLLGVCCKNLRCVSSFIFNLLSICSLTFLSLKRIECFRV
jgi:hypothetical protein